MFNLINNQRNANLKNKILLYTIYRLAKFLNWIVVNIGKDGGKQFFSCTASGGIDHYNDSGGEKMNLVKFSICILS